MDFGKMQDKNRRGGFFRLAGCAVALCIVFSLTFTGCKKLESIVPSQSSQEKERFWEKEETEERGDSKDVTKSQTEDDFSEEPKGYSVSSSSEYATDAAAQVLEYGGNAVDAAVALAYTLAVTEPYASGLGGGGCMMIYNPETEEYWCYDYASEAGRSGGSSTILVPGFVSGMDAVLSDFGTMSLEELLKPAIAYCDGVEVNETLAVRIDAASGSISGDSTFFKNGEPLSTGDMLVQPELKETLQILAKQGADAFYSGEIAGQIAASSPLTMEDLAGYQTIRTDAVLGAYQGYTVAAAAAPFSGATLIQMLEMAEMLDMPSPETDTQTFLNQLRQITAAAHSDRVRNIFDMRFGEPTSSQEETVSEDYIAALLQLDTLDYEDEEESEDTTGFTIIDHNGMVVACTNTLSSFFGSKSVVSGFYLNNSGYNFGSGVNAYEAGKRPRTHIAPTILRSGNDAIAIASPGGNVIVKVLSEVLIDILQFQTPADEAIAKQRVVFKTANQIYYEIGYDTPLLAEVSGSGFDALPYNNHSYFGDVAYSSYREAEGFEACADVRRQGKGSSSE